MHSPCQKSPEMFLILIGQQHAYCENIKVHDGLVVQTMSADHFPCSRRPGCRWRKERLTVPPGSLLLFSVDVICAFAAKPPKLLLWVLPGR